MHIPMGDISSPVSSSMGNCARLVSSDGVIIVKSVEEDEEEEGADEFCNIPKSVDNDDVMMLNFVFANQLVIEAW